MAEDAPDQDRFARRLFILSTGVLIFSVGFVAGCLKWFPYNWVATAFEGMDDLQHRVAVRHDPASLADSGRLPNHLKKVTFRPGVTIDAPKPEDLTLVTYINDRVNPAAELVDGSGKTVHLWELDWFKLWPNATHLPEKTIPKSRPGCFIHGAVVLEDRKLVFNFSGLGLMCVDRDSKEVWRLPYATHHSLHLTASGTLWACGKKRHDKTDPRQPARPLPFDEYTVIEVSKSGELLGEWSVDNILIKNGHAGLMSLSTDTFGEVYAHDILHLNDVEPFPEHFEPGFFKPGDVMVSLRNINCVLVFDRETERLRYITSGAFSRQHDPDFIDGNRISVFDNNKVSMLSKKNSSRICIIDARDHSVEVVYEGTDEAPFYTSFAGKHQWLANGHLIITESCEGRAFELNRELEIVWDIRKHVDDDIVTLVTQADRLKPDQTSLLPQMPNLNPTTNP